MNYNELFEKFKEMGFVITDFDKFHRAAIKNSLFSAEGVPVLQSLVERLERASMTSDVEFDFNTFENDVYGFINNIRNLVAMDENIRYSNKEDFDAFINALRNIDSTYLVTYRVQKSEEELLEINKSRGQVRREIHELNASSLSAEEKMTKYGELLQLERELEEKYKEKREEIRTLNSNASIQTDMDMYATIRESLKNDLDDLMTIVSRLTLTDETKAKVRNTYIEMRNKCTMGVSNEVASSELENLYEEFGIARGSYNKDLNSTKKKDNVEPTPVPPTEPPVPAPTEEFDLNKFMEELKTINPDVEFEEPEILEDGKYRISSSVEASKLVLPEGFVYDEALGIHSEKEINGKNIYFEVKPLVINNTPQPSEEFGFDLEVFVEELKKLNPDADFEIAEKIEGLNSNLINSSVSGEELNLPEGFSYDKDLGIYSKEKINGKYVTIDVKPLVKTKNTEPVEFEVGDVVKYTGEANEFLDNETEYTVEHTVSNPNTPNYIFLKEVPGHGFNASEFTLVKKKELGDGGKGTKAPTPTPTPAPAKAPEKKKGLVTKVKNVIENAKLNGYGIVGRNALAIAGMFGSIALTAALGSATIPMLVAAATIIVAMPGKKEGVQSLKPAWDKIKARVTDTYNKIMKKGGPSDEYEEELGRLAGTEEPELEASMAL